MLKKIICSVNLFVIACLMLFQTPEIKAAWLDLDTSFGFQGVSLEQISGYYPQSVAIQTDGKILITGYKVNLFGSKDFFLRRYHSNGALDTSFGSNGEVINSQVSGFQNNYQGINIVVGADAKISVSGRANDFHAVWQFDSTGKKVKTFGQNGLKTLTQYQTDYRFPDLNVQNGKLLLTFPKLGASGEPIILIRLNANGEIDQTFGNSGESLTSLIGDINGANKNFGTVVESDGKITIAGKAPGNDFTDHTLDRKLPNGKTDRSFLPTISTEIGRIISGIIKFPDGKYAIWTNNSGLSITVTKFSATGSVESSRYLPSFGSCHINIFTLQNDGKLLFGQNGQIFRLNAELEYSSYESEDWCQNIYGGGVAAIQSDDKMVLASNYNNNLLMRRLLPN